MPRKSSRKQVAKLFADNEKKSIAHQTLLHMCCGSMMLHHQHFDYGFTRGERSRLLIDQIYLRLETVGIRCTMCLSGFARGLKPIS